MSPSQREAFDTTLSDPARVSALVAEEFQSDPPWWELANRVPETEEQEVSGEVHEYEEAVVPELVDEKLLPPLKVGEDGKVVANPLLVYIVVAVLCVFPLGHEDASSAPLRRFAYAIPSIGSLAAAAGLKSPKISLISSRSSYRRC